jgi:hypothetical protein
MRILDSGDRPRLLETTMEQDDFRILQEQERDRLMELHCRAEHAAFNVIEGLNELNRIEAEGAFKLHQAFAECLAAIDAASAKLREPQ